MPAAEESPVVRIDHGSHDRRDPALDVDVARDSVALAGELAGAAACATAVERTGGHGLRRRIAHPLGVE